MTNDKRSDPTDIDGLNKDLARARNEQQEHLRTLKSGAVYDTQLGQIVANPGGGKYAITPERSQEMHQQRRERARQEILRVAAMKAGVDVDNATQEEIDNGAATAAGALWGHAYDLAMGSKNPRSIEGIFPKLLEALLGNLRPGEEGGIANQADAMIKIMSMIRRIEREEVHGKVIDAQ